LVADGSGGHLIPALEVAQALAQTGAEVKLWYAKRPQMAPLAEALAQGATEVETLAMDTRSNVWGRLWGGGQLWSRAMRCFETFAPDVVVGFGGWISAPVVLAACLRRATTPPWRGRQATARRIHCVIHEQNVVMGQANRLLAPWVDRIALSFEETVPVANGASTVITGLPVRRAIGRAVRAEAARRFALDPERPTLLVLGGSQGARAINRLMVEALARLSPEECRCWQMIHLTGPADEAMVRSAYAQSALSAWIAPFLREMELAFAHADAVLSRAGASTLAELSRCGLPAILIPYPYAGAHQRANARLLELDGAAIVLEEAQASPLAVLDAARRLLGDPSCRAAMGQRMRERHVADAVQRLTDTILDVAGASHGR